MKTDPILEGALARLQIGWTQVHTAQDAKGDHADPTDPDAVAWCALGALTAAFDSLGLDVTSKADNRLYRQACYRVAFAMPMTDGTTAADGDWKDSIEGCVSNWNDDDDHTQEDVVLAFKRALYG